jgi:hypothetical protein
MSDTELLLKEIEGLPASYMGEILDFVNYLKHKNSSAMEFSRVPRSKLELPPALDPEEALKEAARRSADPNRKPISRHFGCLKNSKTFAGDPVEIQRAMRAEWD